MRQTRNRWITLAVIAATAFGAAACSGGAGSPASGAATPAPPTSGVATPVPRTSGVATPAAPTSGAATVSAGECWLDAPSQDWAPVPSDGGRCSITVLGPTMSFDAPAGWQWGATQDSWAMSMDEGAVYNTFLQVYRYGGAVVPAYCQDPPPEVPMATGKEIVAWLDAVDGLDAAVKERTVGRYRAWQLDLAAIPGAASCSGDTGKQGLISLWTGDGTQFEQAPVTLGTGERMRAYLVETESGIIVLAATTQELDDPRPFFDGVDALFGSLRID